MVHPSLGKRWTDSLNIHRLTANPVFSYWPYPPQWYPVMQDKYNSAYMPALRNNLLSRRSSQI